MKWALKNFNEWRKARSSRPEARVPVTLLEDGDPKELNKWLSFTSLRRETPRESRVHQKHYQLMCGLLRYMHSVNPSAPDFLNKDDIRFNSLLTVMDNRFKELRVDGVGSNSKHTEILTKEEEGRLWGSGVLNSSNPMGLLRAVFFLNGKNFCLRGRDEHRNLRISQMRRYYNPHKYVYTENASKNRQGGLKQLRIENKSVPILATPEAGNRCHVQILDLYLSKLPLIAKDKDLFYWRPFDTVPKDPAAPWYMASPVGKNVLGDMMKNICKEAGIVGKKTNHSLRATRTSELFAAGVPERIIQQRTGHRSLDALRLYERPTEKQQQAISSVLASAAPTPYSSALMQQTQHLPAVPASPVADPTRSFPMLPAPTQNFYNCTVNIYNAPTYTSCS